MKVINKSARLLCFQTSEGRVEVLPGVVTDDKRLDSLKGKDKIFDHYIKEEIIREVKKGEHRTPKELLQDELETLGGQPGEKTVKELGTAIVELLVEKAEDLDVDVTDMTKAEMIAAIEEAEEDL